jgi:antitoxin MazE
MQVSKWGNSLAVRLPKKLVEQMGLAAGDVIDLVQTSERGVAIVKADDRDGFIEKMNALSKPMPEGFRWNRDEANER